MAKIELGQSVAAVSKELAALDNAGLVAQQICFASVAHALEFLLNYGVTEEVIRAMLGQVRETQDVANALAEQRGIRLTFEPNEFAPIT